MDESNIPADVFAGIERIHIVACGTSWHAGLAGKFLLEEMARIPADVDYGSEFRYRNPILNSRSLVIAISQSGETADTLAAVRKRGQKTPGFYPSAMSSQHAFPRKRRYIVHAQRP